MLLHRACCMIHEPVVAGQAVAKLGGKSGACACHARRSSAPPPPPPPTQREREREGGWGVGGNQSTGSAGKNTCSFVVQDQRAPGCLCSMLRRRRGNTGQPRCTHMHDRVCRLKARVSMAARRWLFPACRFEQDSAKQRWHLLSCTVRVSIKC